MPAPTRRILLYSPDVLGHPRVYCRVIADALAGEPCELTIAMGFTPQASLQDSADLQPLVSRPGVRLIDTASFSPDGRSNLSAESIVRMQMEVGADVTLFIEADKSNPEFARIARGEAPRLRGRNLGIFANTAEWYPGEDSFTGERKGLVAPTLKTTLGNIKRAIFNRKNTPRHFYENTIIASNVLREVLVKDERLAAWRGAPVHWMPEISRPAPVPESAAEAAEFERRRTELDDFIAANPGRELVLYFGDAAFYKGYDLFLEFVATTPSTCAIHAGRLCDAEQRAQFRNDFEPLRARLLSEGRLCETDAYVHTQHLKELYFGAIRLYLTTHRLALSSSTVIQALELGKPVMVPDRGILGHRVRTHRLGGVYRYEDMNDLREQALALWKSDLGRFAAPARAFWSRFSDEAIRSFFVERLFHAS